MSGPSPVIQTSPTVRRTRSRWRAVVLMLSVASVVLTRHIWWPRYCCVRAERAVSERNYDDALLWVSAVSRLTQPDPETLLLKARIIRKQGRMNELSDVLQSALDAGASAVRVNREQWLAMAQSGQMTQAEPFLSRLLTDQSDDLEEVCEAYVTGYMRTLNFAAAIRLLDLWIADFSNNPFPHVLKGRIYSITDDQRSAEQCFRTAVSMSPGNAEFQLDLARSIRQLNRPEEAIRILRELSDTGIFRAQVALERGLAERSLGNMQAALEDLVTAAKLSPNDASVLLELGRTHFETGRSERAYEVLSQALALMPTNDEIHYVLAQVLQALGKPDDAQSHFEFSAEARKAKSEINRLRDRIHKDPRDVEALAGIGEIMLKYDRPEEGIVRLLAALELDPNHQTARRQLAEYYQDRAKTNPEFQTLADEHRRWLKTQSSPSDSRLKD